MKKYIDFASIPETDRMAIFTEIAPAHLVGKKLAMAWGPNSLRYDAKINLETLEVCEDRYSEEYQKFDGIEINELLRTGVMADWYPYKRAEIDDILPPIWSLDPEDDPNIPAYNIESVNPKGLVDKLVQDCKKLGFTVTKEAVQHQLENWAYDCKSGYRDEANGYHLFTPCGHNPFSLRISELHSLCDWQETYGL